MAAHAHLNNEFTEDEKCHNLKSWLLYFLGDDGEGSLVSDEERREVVSLDTWLNKPDVIYSCQCREVDTNGFVHPRLVE